MSKSKKVKYITIGIPAELMQQLNRSRFMLNITTTGEGVRAALAAAVKADIEQKRVSEK